MSTAKSGERPTAFVIMPFDREFTANYDDLIKPALEEAGYDVVRADSDLHQQNILRKIVKGITRAKLIVADLTTLNPNVLYELGLSHGLNMPTIILAQSQDQVPFDLRSYNITTYSTHFHEVGKLKTTLKEIGEKHIKGQVLFENPVVDFAPESVSTSQLTNGLIDGSVGDQGVETSGDEMGIWEANQASQKLAKVFIGIVEEINGSVNMISPLLDSFDELSGNPSPGTTAEAQAIANQISSELDKRSARLEQYSLDVGDNIKVPLQVMLRYLALLDPNDEGARAQLEQYRQMFSGLSEKMPLALRGLKSYRKSVSQIGLRSGMMGPASRRNILAVEKITDAMGQIQAFISRAIQVITERLDSERE